MWVLPEDMPGKVEKPWRSREAREAERAIRSIQKPLANAP